jgi:hypothetical protein
MRSADNNRSSSTLSDAPSLSSSRPSINNSKISLGPSTRGSQQSLKSTAPTLPPTREEIIAAYLDKAKWYTSVCLGKFVE